MLGASESLASVLAARSLASLVHDAQPVEDEAWLVQNAARMMQNEVPLARSKRQQVQGWTLSKVHGALFRSVWWYASNLKVAAGATAAQAEESNACPRPSPMAVVNSQRYAASEKPQLMV
jgi:hypothetical protein